jgi:demethylmenaquinone methyltransferase/2-methoxy-6-polyprenyl-1,4-benzoquinol methylase
VQSRIDPATKTGPQIRSMFEAIAPRYDLLNRVLSVGLDRSWRRLTVNRVLEQMAPRDDLSVLDVCCGTGDLAREFGSRPSVSSVVGVDFATSMIEIARRRSADPRFSWVVGDALRLPLRSVQFDVACMAFGLRNLVDPAAGLRRLAGLLRTGGQLVVLEFFQPASGVLQDAFRFYFRRVLPRVGRWLSGTSMDAYRYLPESVEAFARPPQVVQWLKDAGLVPRLQLSLAMGTTQLIVAEKPTAKLAELVDTDANQNRVEFQARV